MSSTLLTRRAALAAGAGLAAAAALPHAFAAAPARYVPYKVGAFTVTPMLDGIFPIEIAMIPDADTPAGKALLEAAGRPAAGPTPEPVNAFTIKRGDRTILLDSGAGGLFGPSLGKVGGALDEAGVAPAAINMILVTHLHADHVGGLMNADKTARFPNAELVVQAAEVAFWTDEGIRAQAPEGMATFFDAARATLAAYRGRVRQVTGEAELAPGLRAMPLPGHTPGHYGVLVEDGGEKLLVWGDVIHSALLQLPNPAWSIAFDVDKAQAAATRARVLDMVVAEKLAVAGMHMATQGRIERRGAGYALAG